MSVKNRAPNFARLHTFSLPVQTIAEWMGSWLEASRQTTRLPARVSHCCPLLLACIQSYYLRYIWALAHTLVAKCSCRPVFSLSPMPLSMHRLHTAEQSLQWLLFVVVGHIRRPDPVKVLACLSSLSCPKLRISLITVSIAAKIMWCDKLLCAENKRYLECMPKSRTFSLVACKSWSLKQSCEPVLKLTCWAIAFFEWPWSKCFA